MNDAAIQTPSPIPNQIAAILLPHGRFPFIPQIQDFLTQLQVLTAGTNPSQAPEVVQIITETASLQVQEMCCSFAPLCINPNPILSDNALTQPVNANTQPVHPDPTTLFYETVLTLFVSSQQTS